MELDKNHPLLLQELEIIQIAILKQIVQIRELLESLIKQEKPKQKKEPEYVKYL